MKTHASTAEIAFRHAEAPNEYHEEFKDYTHFGRKCLRFEVQTRFPQLETHLSFGGRNIALLRTLKIFLQEDLPIFSLWQGMCPLKGQEIKIMANQALITITTMAEMEDASSGRVHVRSSACEGIIDFQHRHMVHASTGELSGEAAFLWMLMQNDAEVFWSPQGVSSQMSLNRPVSDLLIELMQMEDSGETTLEEVMRRYPLDTQAPRPSRDYSNCCLQLEAVSPEMDGFTQELNFGSYMVGKSEDCAVPVPHPTISRHHCTLQFDVGCIVVTDNASMNGTFVNGQMITESFLQCGDILALGTIMFRVTLKIRRTVAARPEEWVDGLQEVSPMGSDFKKFTQAISRVFLTHA